MRCGTWVLLLSVVLIVGACGPALDAVDRESGDEVAESSAPHPELGTPTAAPAVGSADAPVPESAPAPGSLPAAQPEAHMLTVSDVVTAPLAGDMLSFDEARRAEVLVVEAPALAGILSTVVDRDRVLRDLSAAGGVDAGRVAAMAEGATYRVLYTQRAPDKSGAGRAAEVLLFRYDTGEAVRARVDLETDAVEVLDAGPLVPLPVTPAEIAEAAVVARADERVRAALEAAGLDPDTAPANGLLTGTDDAQSPCATRRCLRLFFGDLRAPVPTFSVVFDAVGLQVVEVEQMPGEGGSR